MTDHNLVYECDGFKLTLTSSRGGDEDEWDGLLWSRMVTALMATLSEPLTFVRDPSLNPELIQFGPSSRKRWF